MENPKNHQKKRALVVKRVKKELKNCCCPKTGLKTPNFRLALC
jgi:hypothetical protein